MPKDSPWVTISRYLSPARSERLRDLLAEAGIDARLDPEGSTEENLRRVRVPLEVAEAAFEALSGSIDEDYRRPPPCRPSRLGKLFRKALGGSTRSSSVQGEAPRNVETALGDVRKDPSSAEARLGLARALMEADDADLEGVDHSKRMAWARLALDEAVFLGLGPAASFEMAEISLDEGEVEEASAWIAEATASRIDPVRAAYLQCELAFHRGDVKALRHAVSQYRRLLDKPDFNLVYSAALLFAAGEKALAVRLADGALRDGQFRDDEEWVSAVALKVSMEGADPETVSDLADFLTGEAEAREALAEARSDLSNLRSSWKDAVRVAKKSRDSRQSRTERDE